MKWFYGITIFILTLIVALNLNNVIIFLLSGFIPVLNISLAPSTMLAVIAASIVILIVIRHYGSALYRRMIVLYDDLFLAKTTHSKVSTAQSTSKKNVLPRRRYSNL